MTPALALAARRLLGREGSDGKGSPKQVAAGAVEAWKKLFAHLAQHLGEGGIRALFERSLTLTRAKFPWLPSLAEAPPQGSPWVALRASLETRGSDEALEASVAMVAAFIGLLGKFIGEDLTMRLLQEVWPEITPPTTKETT